MRSPEGDAFSWEVDDWITYFGVSWMNGDALEIVYEGKR